MPITHRLVHATLAAALFLTGATRAAAQDAPDQPVDMKEIMKAGKPPRPIRQIAPVYPRAMAASGLGATVTVSFIIDLKGNVQNPVVVKSSSPGFDQAAIDAIQGWKFSPAEMNGRPVSTRVGQTLKFTLNPDDHPRGGTPERPGNGGAAGKDGTKPARAIRQEPPVFPYAMKKSGLAGRVTLDFIVDEQGGATEIHVIRSNNPWYERPAIDALRKWKYTPAERDGHPVKMRAEQEFTFAVEGSPKEFWSIAKGKDHEQLPPELRWDSPPAVIGSTFPVYPFEALRDRVTGKVRVTFVVGEDGAVLQSKVDEATTPEMGQAVQAAVESWRFQPARNKDGKACLAKLGMAHDFTLGKDSDAPVSSSAREILRLLEKHPEQIIPFKDLDQPPKTRWSRAPQHPAALQQAGESGESGEALVEIYIDAQGDVQLPRIVSGSRPEFGYAAVQAVATWQFDPPRKGGKPAVTTVRVPFNFRIRDSRTPAVENGPGTIRP